jgi:glycosyltransferase involved in cell wall biosynthesis
VTAAGRPAGISVVVPFHADRLPLLERLLVSLDQAGREFAGPWECIVVDDSGPAVEPEVRELVAAHGGRYLRGPAPAGPKRNVGAAAALHDVVLFLDSDIVASPGLLSAHLERLCAAGDQVGGVLGMVEFSGGRSLTWDIAERSGTWRCFAWAADFQRVLWGPTANLAVRAGAFAAVGGFDEGLSVRAGGEDVALGVRLTEAGRPLLTCRAALVWHDREHATAGAMLRRFYRYGRGEGYDCAQFPARTTWTLSPAQAGLALALLLAVVPVGGVAWRVGAPLLTVAATAAVDLWRWRRGMRAFRRRARPGEAQARPDAVRSFLLDLACLPFGWANVAGLTVQALSTGRPWFAFRRFKFVTFDDFELHARPARR